LWASISVIDGVKTPIIKFCLNFLHITIVPCKKKKEWGRKKDKFKEEFEDAKEIIRICKSKKERQHND